MQKKAEGGNGNSLLTLPEVQSYLGIRSRKTVLKYIISGKLRAYKLAGTRWRIALSDLKCFLDDHALPGRRNPAGWDGFDERPHAASSRHTTAANTGRA